MVVSQYFPPEIGATQNRMQTFVDGLLDRGHSVTVVCEQPNHPAGVFQPGFGRRPLVTERRERCRVRRLWVAASPRKTPRRRMAFYGTFAAGAFATIAAEARHDVVFATSPPLPGALAAGAAAAIRRAPLVVDVRDLWPAAAEALGELSDPRLLRAFERGERWLYRRAAAVTATTRPFCVHIDRVAARRCSTHLPNGALDSLLARPVAQRPPDGRFVVGYVGNLGIAQGLGIVFDAARSMRGEDVTFWLVGDGPLSRELTAERDRDGLEAVEIRPATPVDRVGPILESCDALLVPLRAHELLGDFVPSKLYDAMAVGRPVIAAAGREAATLVRETGCGLVVAPEDGPGLVDAVRALAADRDRARRLGEAGRRAAGSFARSRQVERLEALLREVGNASRRG